MSIPIFLQNVFNFSLNWALVFLSTTERSWGVSRERWTGRKGWKNEEIFSLFKIYFHKLRIRETQRENKILVPHLTPMCTRAYPDAVGICRKSTSLCITYSYFICYQDERKISFHFSPAHIHIKKITEIYTILSLMILSHTGLSLLTTQWNWTSWAQGAFSADNSLLGNDFVPMSQTLFSNCKSVLARFMEELE